MIKDILVPLISFLAGFFVERYLGQWMDHRKTDRRLKYHLRRVLSPVDRFLPPRREHASAPTGGMKYGALSIPGFRVFDGVFLEGIDFVVKLDEHPAVLPADLLPLLALTEASIAANPSSAIYRGTALAMKSFSFTRTPDAAESAICRVAVQPNDFYHVLAANANLDAVVPGTNETVRQRYYDGRDPRRIEHAALHTAFPINLAVITNDQRLVVVRRSERVAFSPGVYNSPVDEALSLADTDEFGHLSYDRLIRRGLSRELGVETAEIADARLVAVGYEHRLHHYAALGYAKIRLTFDDLRSRLVLAKEGTFELAVTQNGEHEIHGIEFEPRALESFLLEHTGPAARITSFGLASLLLAFLAHGDHPSSLAREFTDPRLATHDFIL